MATYARLSFTNDEEKALIAFIEKHPSMWRPQHAHYNNYRMRLNNWQEIAQQLNKSELECRRKWRFIRDYYVNKRRNVSAASGNGHSKYEHLAFLNVLTAQRRKFVDDAVTDEDDLNDAGTSTISLESSGTALETAFENEEDELCVEEHLFEKVSETETADKSEGHVRTKLNAVKLANMPDERAYEVVSNNSEDSKMTASEPDENERLSAEEPITHNKVIDLFFESISATVKTFPPLFVAQTKKRIFQIVNDLELELYGSKEIN